LTYVSTHCCPNFNALAVSNLKLWISKISKLDVCGRPLFANPVTFNAKVQLTRTFHLGRRNGSKVRHLLVLLLMLLSQGQFHHSLESSVNTSNLKACTFLLIRQKYGKRKTPKSWSLSWNIGGHSNRYHCYHWYHTILNPLLPLTLIFSLAIVCIDNEIIVKILLMNKWLYNYSGT